MYAFITQLLKSSWEYVFVKIFVSQNFIRHCFEEKNKVFSFPFFNHDFDCLEIKEIRHPFFVLTQKIAKQRWCFYLLLFIRILYICEPPKTIKVICLGPRLRRCSSQKGNQRKRSPWKQQHCFRLYRHHR